MLKKIIFMMFIYVNMNTNFIKSHYPGILCTIEGVDGSGKSTLLKKLNELLAASNIRSMFTKEPGSTKLGEKIRKMILEKEFEMCPLSEFLLFASDRAQHFQEFIIPWLNQGYLIISDRMADSSLAYQGYLKKLDINIIKNVNNYSMQHIEPDIIFYLKIPAIEARKRITTIRNISDKFEQELLDHLEQLVYAFDDIFKDRSNVIIIDAMLDPEEIVKDVFDNLVGFYNKRHFIY